MIRFFKFRQDLFDPAPAKEVYEKRGPGRGWPEECPPIRTAQAFGFDLLANFGITFVNAKGRWRVEPDIVLESDFDWSPTDDAPGKPLTQQYAWFWKKGQKIPHVISDNVYRQVRNQVKISSFLYLESDQNELLMFTHVPNLVRRWRAMTAVVETDWYPASYPWHIVLELDPAQKRIKIEKGEPLCRIIPVRRDTYFARPMSAEAFDEFFQRGQHWLATHGHGEHEGAVDITRTYVRQQVKSRFIVRQ